MVCRRVGVVGMNDGNGVYCEGEERREERGNTNPTFCESILGVQATGRSGNIGKITLLKVVDRGVLLRNRVDNRCEGVNEDFVAVGDIFIDLRESWHPFRHIGTPGSKKNIPLDERSAR